MKRPILATLLALGLGVTSAAHADERIGLDDLPLPLSSPLSTVANRNQPAAPAGLVIGAVSTVSRGSAPVTSQTKAARGLANAVGARANAPSTVPFMGARGGVGGAAAVSGSGMTGTTITFPDEKKGDSKGSSTSSSGASGSTGTGSSAGSSLPEGSEASKSQPIATGLGAGGSSTSAHSGKKNEPAAAPVAISPPRPLSPVVDATRPTEGKVVLFLRTPGEDEASVEAIRTRLAREAAVIRRIAPDLSAGRSPGTIAEDNVLRDAAPPGFYLPDEIDAWLVANDGKIYILEVQGAVFEKVASQAIGSPLAVEGEKPAHDATLEPGVHRFRVKAIVAPGAAGSSDAQG